MRRRCVLVVLLLAGLACTSTTDAPTVASLQVTPNPVSLIQGDSVQLAVSALDGNEHLVTGIAVTFASADTTIVRVSNIGVVRSSGAIGTTNLTVSGGGRTRQVPASVYGVPASIELRPGDTTIVQGDSVQYRATVRSAQGDTLPVAVTFASSDTLVVTISATGRARSRGPTGLVGITASGGGFNAGSILTVRDSSLGARVPLAGGPYGAAISSTGVAYVTLPGLSKLGRANLPSQTFTAPTTVGNIPTEVAFNSSGSLAYVTNQFSGNVGIVDVASNTQIDLIDVTGDPFEVIVTPGDSIIYVSTNVDSVYCVRLSTKARVTAFATPAIGNGFALRNDTLLYVSTHTGGTIIEFNIKTRTLARTFTVGGTPQKLALSADGNELYIANEAGYMQFWNLVTGAQIGGNLALGSAGYGMARRPSTGQLYVTSAYFGGGNIYIVNPVTRALTRTIVAGGSTRRVVFNASGTIGFVPNESGWIDFLK